MHVLLGIDENGLGPRLGPLVVTGVRARCISDRARRLARSAPKGSLGERLGDSKNLVSYGHSSLGEAWARAILLSTGVEARTPADVLDRLLVLDKERLRARCPGHRRGSTAPGGHARQCWGTSAEGFASTDTEVSQVARDLLRLEKRGIQIDGLFVHAICTETLNSTARSGKSRLLVDLHAMEDIVLQARGGSERDVEARCGKVGGYDRYAEHFGPLGSFLRTVLKEGRDESRYRIFGVGDVAFVRDADARDLLVGLASIVGKWVRDLFMRRIVGYHREFASDVPNASGYHDPVTQRFVDATRLVRKRIALPDTCFERESVSQRARSVSLTSARDA